jgi:hypothetical protein
MNLRQGPYQETVRVGRAHVAETLPGVLSLVARGEFYVRVPTTSASSGAGGVSVVYSSFAVSRLLTRAAICNMLI